MSKFKIRPYRDGLFKVWELKDMGSGYFWGRCEEGLPD